MPMLMHSAACPVLNLLVVYRLLGISFHCLIYSQPSLLLLTKLRVGLTETLS